MRGAGPAQFNSTVPNFSHLNSGEGITGALHIAYCFVLFTLKYMAFKFWHYFAFSSFLMFSMVVYACYSREQFYPIVLLLLTSKVSFVLMANMAFALALLIGKVCIKLFFGQLRDIEWELVLERCKYSVTETCLALTIFRSELYPSVFAYFLGLLFIKIFHWLSRSRLDYLEQVAQFSARTHTALLVVLFLLVVVDCIVCYQCVTYSFEKGRTVIVLFAFEFGALILSALNNLIRYVLNAIDNSLENGLSYKGLYFMILDLICGGLKFGTYAAFFCVVFVFYGLPIHIVRCAYCPPPHLLLSTPSPLFVRTEMSGCLSCPSILGLSLLFGISSSQVISTSDWRMPRRRSWHRNRTV